MVPAPRRRPRSAPGREGSPRARLRRLERGRRPALARPWPPPAIADSGAGAAPSLCGPALPPAASRPGLSLLPRSLPPPFSSSSLSPHFPSPPPSLPACSRPPFRLLLPATGRCPFLSLPSPAAPSPYASAIPALLAGGSSGWGAEGTSLGCLLFSFLATMAAQPGTGLRLLGSLRLPGLGVSG